METDIPLRTLTQTCAADLLPLLGAPEDQVLSVEALELPALATRLDNLLRLRDRQGRTYLHLLEWQGYHDLRFLWRVLGYLGWLGVHRPERPILVTLIYLTPGADVGAELRQGEAAQVQWAAQFRVVRLWEEDALAAAHSGRVGLAVLSPLMRGATAALVDEVAQVVRGAEREVRRRADLLSILGVLAEDLVAPERFVAMMGREHLMASTLLTLLMQEKTAELEVKTAELDEKTAELEVKAAALEAVREREHAQLMHELEQERERERAQLAQERERERAERERERAERERERTEQEEVRDSLAQAVEETIAARFPAALLALAPRLHRIQKLQTLRDLLRVALHASTLEAIEQAIAAASS